VRLEEYGGAGRKHTENKDVQKELPKTNYK